MNYTAPKGVASAIRLGLCNTNFNIFYEYPLSEGFVFDISLERPEGQRFHPSIEVFAPLLFLERVSDVSEDFQGDDWLFELFCIFYNFIC